MKLLFINQFYYPDISATSQIATELCEDLAALGHEVTVLAAQGTYDGGGDRLSKRETVRGVKIERVWSSSLGKRTIGHRAADYASFYVSAARKAVMLPKFDVVVAMSTPPLIALVALMTRARGARTIYWLQDIYPDLAIEFGVLARDAPSAHAMSALNSFILSTSDATVVLSAAMKQHLVAKGAPAGRISVIPNWADGSAIVPVPHEQNPLRASLAPENQFVVMYSGNMGRAHDLKTIVEAARLLKARKNITFVVSGGGAQKEWLMAEAHSFENLVVRPYVQKSDLGNWLAAGDLHLVTMAKTVGGLLEPSKAYGILAAGRPIAFVGPRKSGVAQMVIDHDVGIVVDNGDAEALAAGIVALADDPNVRKSKGEAARSSFEEHFDRKLAVRRFSQLMRSLVREKNTEVSHA